MYTQSRLSNKYKLGITEPIVEYEPNVAGVRVYSGDNTKIDRLWNRTTDTTTAKIASQNTSANMPIWTDNDADFNGHGSLTFTSSQSMIVTDTISIPSVSTHYYVLKLPSAFSSFNNVIDGNASG